MTKTKKSAAAKTSLPRWDLNDLYKGPNDARLKTDLAKVAQISAALQKKYAGKIAKLAAPALAAAIKEYEALQDLSGKLGTYAYLYYCLKVTDPARGQFMQSVTEALNDAGTKLVFFTLEINQISPAN